jgi:hypothetical protein
MRVPDSKLAEVRERGYTVVEGFLDADTLAAARDALWTVYPRPEEYFAHPDKYPELGKSQFSGLRTFPFQLWELSRVSVYPDLIDAAERLLSTADIELYKGELWAKYSGAINYDQFHHRDYGNHSLVVPRVDGKHMQMTTFVLLSDVDENDGPTKIAPLHETRDIPLGVNFVPKGELFDKEVAITGPAGTLMIYKTDVFHRGSDFKASGRSRFAILTDFQARGARWQGRMSWPDRGGMKEMAEALTKMSPRQRDLFGWPPPGSDYWNEQTLRDVAQRYPKMDLAPYR